jgi:KDO2-lipid IV(A) lauroyltransferase
MSKERNKLFRRKAGFLALKTFAGLMRHVTLRESDFLGELMGRAAYWCAVRHRKIALENLGIAFPEATGKEKKAVTRQFFVFMVQSYLETLHVVSNLHKPYDIRIEGKENLDAALSQKRGVICVTAHFGNFPLLSTKLALEGYPISVMARPMRDPEAGDFIHYLRTEAGVKTVFSYPRKEAVSNTLKRLRDNELVAIQMDQNFGTGGVWVRFFGKLAATPVGPVVFALRTGAALVPMYIVRERTGSHCIHILPAQEMEVTDKKEETVLINAVKLTRLIEGWIRQHPAQWGWIHRRWKSTPPKENALPFQVEA